jgi:hypothetical protein
MGLAPYQAEPARLQPVSGSRAVKATGQIRYWRSQFEY